MNDVEKWKDLRECEEYTFEDGSNLTEIHEIARHHCYKFTMKKHPFNVKDPSIVVSEDHYILCELKNINNDWINYIKTIQEVNIPRVKDLHCSYDEENDVLVEVKEEVVESDYFIQEDCVWLSGKSIFTLLMNDQKIKPVGNKFKNWEYVGEKECFCVSTDTGKYKICGLTSHNSVTLRNIIFHSLTHSDDIKLGLVDLKLSEFTKYKEMNNVVGVANSVLEAAELLRLSREVMYKRNQENANRGLTDFKDWKPQKPTGKISIFGREFDENEEFEVEIEGEHKTMTALDLFNFVQENK